MKRQILLSQLASQPWAMHPDHLATMSQVLHRWSAGESASAEVLEGVHAAKELRTARKASTASATGNIAVLNLWGIMTQKVNLVNEVSGGGGTSTQAFTQAFKDALADPSVAGILIDLDSPGGSVTGTPELAAEVMAARGVKPVYGFVNGLAASAAYWVAAQCEAIYSTPSGSAGSIGVYTTHVDVSEAMKKSGVAQEFISAGKFKTEGNSLGPLNPEGRAFAQSRIDTFYGAFTSDVAKGRGVTVSAVKSGYGQGRCLLANDALNAGLIDGVCTFDQVVGKLSARIKGGATAATRAAQSAAGMSVASSAHMRQLESAQIQAAIRKREIELASI